MEQNSSVAAFRKTFQQFRNLPLLMLSLLLPLSTYAQNFATISGTVSDKTGTAVAAARVSAQNLDTLVSREAVSDDSGLFTLPLLQPGQKPGVVILEITEQNSDGRRSKQRLVMEKQ